MSAVVKLEDEWLFQGERGVVFDCAESNVVWGKKDDLKYTGKGEWADSF